MRGGPYPPDFGQKRVGHMAGGRVKRAPRCGCVRGLIAIPTNCRILKSKKLFEKRAPIGWLRIQPKGFRGAVQGFCEKNEVKRLVL